MMKDIRQQLDIINRAIDWADTYNKDTFPREELREYRRQIKNSRCIGRELLCRCIRRESGGKVLSDEQFAFYTRQTICHN